MKKTILFLLMLLPMAVSMSVQAEDFESGGVYYRTASIGVSVVKGADAYSGNVVIPATVEHNGAPYDVTGIAAEAFKGSIHLKSVTIGSKVKFIGYRAFYGCEELEEIVIPDNVTQQRIQRLSEPSYCDH